VRSGGNLAGTGGSINGAAFFAGSYTAPANQITTGPASYGTPFSAALDLAAASAYFLAASNYAAALANTTLHTNTNGGQIDVTTVSGLNVVTISAAELNSAYAFNVHGPGTLVINVTGTGTVSLDSTTWSYDNGAASTRTLLNYNQATGLNLSSGNVVNILAPNAAVNFSSGNLNGNLVAGSLAGSGQVNWVGTAQFSTIPAPGAAGTLALTALAATRRKRRR
ncbi:MAG: choice-of-anchor A family protein, partial [Phycisphaerales bacterium]|nr:choice-of-anchor A family protein [Phycisphaerales bacterium]